jgi:hypothetical protein
VLSPFVGQELGTWIATQPKEDLEALRELLEAGKVTPVVDRTFALSEVPERSGTSETGAHAARLPSLSDARIVHPQMLSSTAGSSRCLRLARDQARCS